MDRNAAKESKNISCTKNEAAVDHRTVTRLLKNPTRVIRTQIKDR